MLTQYHFLGTLNIKSNKSQKSVVYQQKTKQEQRDVHLLKLLKSNHLRQKADRKFFAVISLMFRVEKSKSPNSTY